MRPYHLLLLFPVVVVAEFACSSSDDGTVPPVVTEGGGYKGDPDGVGGAGGDGTGGDTGDGGFGGDEASAGSTAAGGTPVYPVTTRQLPVTDSEPNATPGGDDHVVMVRLPPLLPMVDPDTDVLSKVHLYVHLAETNGLTSDSSQFLSQVAEEGFYVISLAYPDTVDVDALCGSDVACYGAVREEILQGVDSSPLVNVSPADSIEDRLTKLLDSLRTLYPQEAWASFLTENTGGSGGSAGSGGAAGAGGSASGSGGTAGAGAGGVGTAGASGAGAGGAASTAKVPLWSQITLSGHRLGAGQAAFASSLHAVEKVVLISGPDDPTGSWLSSPGASGQARFHGFFHTMDPAAPGIVNAWGQLGMQVMPILDSNGDGGTNPEAMTGIIDVDTNAAPYFYQHVLSTSVPPQSGSPADEIDSPITDKTTPMLQGKPIYLPVWKQLTSFD